METSTICNIICTQPRRISALSIAERVSAEIGDVNGPGSRQSLVGYQIRLESKVCESTCLTFCTAGVLLRRLEGKGDLNGVTHVFVDEVHERSLESDFLLLLLKKLCLKRKDLKIILMSATSDAAKFLEYFKDKVPHYMEIPGRTFPVTSFFLEDAIKHCKYVIEPDSEFAHIQSEKRKTVFVDVSGKSGKSSKQRLEWEVDDDFEQEELYYEEQGISYDKAILKTLKRMDLNKVNLDLIESLVHYIHSAGSLDMLDDKPAILVFLPGLGEIKKLFDRLEFDSTRRKLTILPLHSVISTQDQARVFQRPPNGTRKVILSTNIAETGITIPDVGYVIDSCKSRDIGYDSHKHITRLSEVFISKANCLQRRGRAGRVREGICYHLIATYSFEKLVSCF